MINRIKFQGQEHIDDLGLNWDSFKWRNHQPDLGRFFNVDPISEKYEYNSPYAFAENKLGMGVELEGLEMVSFKELYRPNIIPAPGWHPPMTETHTTTATSTTTTQSTTTTTNTFTGKSTTSTKTRVYDVPGGSNLPSEVSTTDREGKSSSVSISFQDTQSDKHVSNNKISTKSVEGLIKGLIIFAGMMDISSITVTATTNGNHSTAIKPLPNWNNPKAKTKHYIQNGGRGIDVGAVNGLSVSNSDSATVATWKVAMDSAGAIENLGPWTDIAHKNHFHTSF